MGHARALLAVADPQWQLQTYKQILEKGLSVRQVEALARQYNSSPSSPKSPKSDVAEGDLQTLETLKSLFGDNVKFTCNRNGKGQITIPFDSRDQLSDIINQLNTSKD